MSTAPRKTNVPAAGQPTTLYTEMRDELRAHSNEFAELLPPGINVTRFIRVAAWSIQAQPRLAQCSTKSIITALLRAATDGLLPDGRESALVPFESETSDGRRELSCQYLPMIAGIRKKIFESGKISNWSVQVVQQNDEFDYQLGSNQYLHHKPSLRGGRNRPVIAAYSIATFPDGTQSIEVTNIDQINDIRSKSRARHGPWSDPIFFPEMCRKTVARLHAKQLPTSKDLDMLFARDDEAYGPALERPTAPARVAPTSTRAALETFAPKTEPPQTQPQGEVIDSENPAPPEAQQTETKKTEKTEPPPLPKNAEEYYQRFQRTLATAKDAASAAHVRQWFASDYEKKLRTKIGISFPQLDQLDAEMKAHLGKFEPQGRSDDGQKQ